MGNLPGVIASVAATHPILLFPFKFAVAYTLLYHYLGALRHFAWDHHKIGNQVRFEGLGMRDEGRALHTLIMISLSSTET